MADRSVEAAGTDVNSTPSSQVSDGPEVQISTSLQQMTPSLDLLFSAAKCVHFVEEMVKLMDPKDLELQNRNAKYCFLLCSCGWNSGNCRSYGEKDERLLMIRGSKGMTPLLMAALLRHSEIVWYLCKKTIDEDSTECSPGHIGTLPPTRWTWLKMGMMRLHCISWLESLLDSLVDLSLECGGS
ncbi:hypothetical protein AAG906_003970 [Vitis piasezkii]